VGGVFKGAGMSRLPVTELAASTKQTVGFDWSMADSKSTLARAIEPSL